MKLLKIWFLVVKVKSSLQILYGRKYKKMYDFVNCYGISVSQMTTDIMSFVVIIIPSIPHSWLITTCLTRSGTVSIPEHISSTPTHPVLVFCRLLFVSLKLSLHCLSFDLGLLITSLVSSKFYCMQYWI